MQSPWEPFNVLHVSRKLGVHVRPNAKFNWQKCGALLPALNLKLSW